ncbi:hypothetical protein B0H10DRAFT_1971321 [Mycena sp. CBHHK59/15]|nr:hypothetical protein B0H10DRAFT_1971321 [Mycena sp. CBHHK59/15]
MPKRGASVLTRIGNFTKKAIERLSPRKERKTEEKENVARHSTSSASVFSLDPRPHNVSDVFLSSPASDLALPGPQTGFFYHTGRALMLDKKSACEVGKFYQRNYLVRDRERGVNEWVNQCVEHFSEDAKCTAKEFNSAAHVLCVLGIEQCVEPTT